MANKSLKPKHVLERAAFRVLDKGWCQGPVAIDKRGMPVAVCDPTAVAWCAYGALLAEGNPTNEADAYIVFNERVADCAHDVASLLMSEAAVL